MKQMLLCFLLGTLLLALSAQANMFKWVDEHGKVHYSNTAPLQNAKSVDNSNEAGGAPQEQTMRNRAKQEMQTNQSQKYEEKNPQDREDAVSTGAKTTTGNIRNIYTININDIAIVNSMSNWLLTNTHPDESYPAPKKKYDVNAPQVRELNKNNPENQFIDPDTQSIDQIKFQQELDRIRRELDRNQSGGGAG